MPEDAQTPEIGMRAPDQRQVLGRLSVATADEVRLVNVPRRLSMQSTITVSCSGGTASPLTVVFVALSR